MTARAPEWHAAPCRVRAPEDAACGERDPGCSHPWHVAGRVPPCDLDAEAAVLSSLFLLSRSEASRCSPLCECADCANADAITEGVYAALRREHFYSDANGWIFEAARSCVEAGACDIVTVASWLRAREMLAAVGGPGYLVQIADATPAVANLRAHVAIVVRLFALRKLIATCQTIAAEGYGAVGDVRDFVFAAGEAVSECAALLPEEE